MVGRTLLLFQLQVTVCFFSCLPVGLLWYIFAIQDRQILGESDATIVEAVQFLHDEAEV